MKKFIKKVKVFFALVQADIELKKATKLADKKFKDYGKRFYVIPNVNHKLIVQSWSQLKKMRKQGLFSAHANEKAFINESFYYTPNRFGKFISKEQMVKKRKYWRYYSLKVKGLL